MYDEIILEVYEKHKELDFILSDRGWLSDTLKSQILYDLWEAIKLAVVDKE